MKIAICGVPTVGKKDVAEALKEKWPSYEVATCDDPIFCVDSRFDIAKLDNIMDIFVDRAMFCDGKKDVVHDGCVLDALAHIYMFFGMHPEANTSVLAKYHAMLYAAIQYYDIIFYIPYRTKYKQDLEKITKDEFMYLVKLDEFYSSIYDEWKKGNNKMFPFEANLGCPPIIELFGTTMKDKMNVLALYIDDDGNAVPPRQMEQAVKKEEKAETETKDNKEQKKDLP